jgi:hypothetical protein
MDDQGDQVVVSYKVVNRPVDTSAAVNRFDRLTAGSPITYYY